MTGRLALIVGGLLLLAFLLIISPAGAGDQGCSGECPASVTGQALNRTPENPSLARRGVLFPSQRRLRLCKKAG